MSHRALFALGISLLASNAFAAADLRVSLAPPVGVRVYDVARYNVTVRNTGNKSASAAGVTIKLPLSNTTPSFSLAQVVARDPRCTLSGATLTCTLGTLPKFSSTVVYADLKLPYSAAPLVLDIDAYTSSAEDSYANNGLDFAVALATYDVPVTTTVGIANQHCTGHDLTSFRECEAFPSSIAGHSAVLNYDTAHSISFPLYGPTYGGTWSQPTPNRLTMQYTEDGLPIMTFDGYGVPGNCFEGVTHFIPDNGYMSIYKVCLQ